MEKFLKVFVMPDFYFFLVLSIVWLLVLLVARAEL